MKRSFGFALLLAALGLLFAGRARALEPLPDVIQGAGYKTWTLPDNLPLLKLEDAMADLRATDAIRHDRVLAALGIHTVYQGRGEWVRPQIGTPVRATVQFLSFDRRKMAVITAPMVGHYYWYAVLLRQDGLGERPWRAFQVFVFATDPERGLSQSFPDILGDDIRFWEVGHTVKRDIYGRAQATSLFRYDEKGSMRLTFQELSHAYLTAKFMGRSLTLDQTLAFPGHQSILRTVRLKSYPWMRREDFERYTDVPVDDAPPAKAWTLRERFYWDPADFDFYDPDQELFKLRHNASPFIRGEAARRLGEHLKAAPAALDRAVWADKSPLVRIQVALALVAIGDPSALPAVDKALRNWNEDNAVRDALQEARDSLEAVQAARAGGAPDAGTRTSSLDHTGPY